MTGLSMRLDEAPGLNAAHVRLFGTNMFDSSLQNAEAISLHVRAKHYSALIMDWRECVMTQNFSQFHTVARIFGETLSGDVAFAVFHRPEQLSYAIVMTRALAGRGFAAAAFSDDHAGLIWLAEREAGPPPCEHVPPPPRQNTKTGFNR